ncbi:MAG TPA: thiamine phosphate synthase [Candidatus Krumholzibacteria bacterium]|nr:thiamine phosphate synthase [Candidatus Krumholzibacteria bacterium]
MRERRRIGRVCVITDVAVQSRFGHVELAELACAGGADVIQLRDKALADDVLISVAREVRRVCDRHGALFVLNDRVLVARESGADGVHLGLDDTPIEAARSVLGDRAVIGATAHSLAEARAADRSSADYLGFGHVFTTSSKARATPPLGVDGLARVCAAVSIPVLAIGGITSTRVPDVMGAGAWGVAVIAEVCTADDPRAATERLRSAVDAGYSRLQ